MARGKHSEFTDSQGRYRTKSLFTETIGKEQKAHFKPMYTLKGDPKFIDLHDLYMETMDPTEYSFALRAFGSWEHFQHLASLQWFQYYLKSWRTELEVKMRSEGIRQLTNAAKEGTRGISAAKYLADRGWETKRGRPSKDEVEKERQIQAAMEEELQGDAARLLN